MDLTSPKIIKELLEKYGTKPSKGLGQNFLIDRNVLKKIIDSADLNSDDVVLEIGPGIGTLTQELAKSVKKIIAVEKSQKMYEILKETLKNYKNIEIINADILKIHPVIRPGAPSNDGANYKVVANIPYYITAPFIRLLLEAENKPELIILLLQKEVAQRICSKPPDMTLLSTSVQFYAEPKIISYVSKSCFWPAPKVDSAIIKIVPNSQKVGDSQLFENVSPDLFFKIVKAGFSQPRKQIGNNLSRALKIDREQVNLWLSGSNIKPEQRAETLSIQDWKNLTKSYIIKE